MSKAITITAAIATAIAVLGGFHHFTSLQVQAEPFDKHQWRNRQTAAQQNDPGCVRGGMALTLLRNKSLNNRSRAQVLEQLGEADEKHQGQLHYSLGQCHWDWRHSALVITFDANGLVERTTIETM